MPLHASREGGYPVADIQSEQAAYHPGIAAGAVPTRSHLRAVVMLVYVVGGACLIVNSVEPMTLTLTGLLVGLEPSDLNFEIVARLGLACSIIGLAVIGATIVGERPAMWPDPARRGSATLTAMALPAGAGALALAIGAAWAGGVAVARPHPAMFDGALFGAGTLLTLIGVLGEELLLRGLLQPLLVRTWGVAAGIVLSSLAFAAIHMVGGWGHPLSLLNILLAGLWFGLLAFRTGGLLAPILAHFGYNWAEELVFGASPNPGIGAFGAITDVDLVGPTIWGVRWKD